MTASDDISAPFQDPNTGQWYVYDFTSGTTQPADPPTDASTPSLQAGSGVTDAAPSTTPSDVPTSSTSTPPGFPDQSGANAGTPPTTTVAPSPGFAGVGDPSLFEPAPVPTEPTTTSPDNPNNPTGAAAPQVSAGNRGTWVDFRTGGSDDNPQLESAVITADHENAGDDGWAYLYVFPRGGLAYPTVANEGDGQDQYRRS